MMTNVRRSVVAILLPPLAMRGRGCAKVCAGPIAVFWLTGIVSIVYGIQGGPTGGDNISWLIVSLGVLLWLVAIAWALLVGSGVSEDARHGPNSTLDHQVNPERYESDPFNQLRG